MNTVQFISVGVKQILLLCLFTSHAVNATRHLERSSSFRDGKLNDDEIHLTAERFEPRGFHYNSISKDYSRSKKYSNDKPHLHRHHTSKTKSKKSKKKSKSKSKYKSKSKKSKDKRPKRTHHPTSEPIAEPTVEPSNSPSVVQVPDLETTASPTLVPTSFCNMNDSARAILIKTNLIPISGVNALNHRESRQYEAFTWLSQQDNAILCPGDESLNQRYTLALLYFSTNGNDWPFCGAIESESPCRDENGNDLVRFLSEVSECEWYGITCDINNLVVGISIGKCTSKHRSIVAEFFDKLLRFAFFSFKLKYGNRLW